MSVFMSQSSFQTVDPEKVKIALIQFEAQAMVFNNLLDSCARKCLGHVYGEEDLATGEQSCVDRCVVKFFKVNQVLGKELQYHKEFNVNKMPEYIKAKLYWKGTT